jgi:hypothetical protein
MAGNRDAQNDDIEESSMPTEAGERAASLEGPSTQRGSDDESSPKPDAHPFYALDAGAPHLAPEDYEYAGLGPFDPNQGSVKLDQSTAEDEQVRQAILEELGTVHTIDARRIEVHVDSRNVMLSGSVEDRYARQRLDLIARGAAAGREVHNRVAVQKHDEEAGRPTLTVQDTASRENQS